jgi:hypothetical protein
MGRRREEERTPIPSFCVTGVRSLLCVREGRPRNRDGVVLMRSNPLWYRNLSSCVSGNNSVVECDLAKVEVAGSNPVSRSILLPLMRTTASAGMARQVGSGSIGAVAKW